MMPPDSFRKALAALPASTVSPWAFFAVTFLLSWAIWIPLVLSHFGVGPVPIPKETSEVVRLVGVLMPALAAVALMWAYRGISGVLGLLQPLKTWNVPGKWWAAAVLVQPAVLIIAAVVFNSLAGKLSVIPVSGVSGSAIAVNIFFLLIASLGEEIGWRGVALPALQRRHGAFWSSAVLGVVWATWHLPFWMLLDTFSEFGVGYLLLNYLFVLPGAFYLTWIYNNTRFSLLLVVMFHVTFNSVNVAFLPVTTSVGAFGIVIAINWVIAIIVSRRLEPASIEMTPG